MKRVIIASKSDDFIYVILRNGDPIAKGSYDAIYKKANNMSVPVDIKKFVKSKFNSYFKMAKDAGRPNPLKFAVNRYINDNRDEYREINGSTSILGSNKGYLYLTKHGIGPGTLPRDVNLLKSKELSRYITAIWLDRFLTTKELDYYDIYPETNMQNILDRNGINETIESLRLM